MPNRYYRGHNKQHAAFWVGFRDLPREKQFTAFIKFYQKIEEAVLTSACTLRDAGYALEPCYYDKALQADPHAADMTVVGIHATELADWVFENQQEAEETWGHIMLTMEKYSLEQGE